MSWDRGYYYQARKIGGRVVKKYVGRGKMAELIALGEAIERQEREQERDEFRAWKESLAEFDEHIDELNVLADSLARAALFAAGFHQHRRGEWRRKRDSGETAIG
jgi:hypothetical protein